MTRTKTIATLGAGLLGAAALAGFTMPPAGQPQAESTGATFTVDPVHSSIVFRATHLGVSHVYGRFNEFEGSFTPEDGGSMEVTVKAGSIDTGADRRDNHLRSPDFFNVKQFPEITFKSTSVESAGENTFDVAGELTMLGKTRPVEVEVTKVGEGDRGPRFGYRAGLATTLIVKRSDFGMTWGIDNGAVGDEVKLHVALEGARD